MFSIEPEYENAKIIKMKMLSAVRLAVRAVIGQVWNMNKRMKNSPYRQLSVF